MSDLSPIPGVPLDRKDWQVAVIDGQPEVMLNRAGVEALIRQSPLGPVEARRRLVAMGLPFDLDDGSAA